ncbi:MAG: thiamine phosphate synthase [Bryobacterales bacterium]|nr:thiamine phosphate synthase [Bryobacterales bacterium]
MIPPIYAILDTGALARRNLPPEAAAEAMLNGGARLLQFRHKGHWSRGMFAAAERIAALCAARSVPLIVNDRADFALLLGAGLHVGQDDLPPGHARRLIGPDLILGFSTHNPDQLAAAAAQSLTYVALGPVFPTGSKENPDPVIQREWLRLPRPCPLVAIGGITRANALEVLEAGADSVAVIADLLPDPCTPETVRARMEEWQRLLTA